MKPSSLSLRTAAIVRAKGRMYEYQVPTEDHIQIPAGLTVEQLFPLIIGTLGDYAAETVWSELREPRPITQIEDLKFSARVLQAYVESQLGPSLNSDLFLLSSAAHYLADSPGSAIVALRRLRHFDRMHWGDLEVTLEALLGLPWSTSVHVTGSAFGGLAKIALDSLRGFYAGVADMEDIASPLVSLREAVYRDGSARELLLSDLLSAVIFRRVRQSARELLPVYSQLAVSHWESYLTKDASLRELWPSQQILGQAGIYGGESAVVQMPTSAGKTKATELVIRSALLSGRASVGVVVAPFRALCQEIADSLRASFAQEAVTVNQLSDALQPDYFSELKELFNDLDDATLAAFGIERRSHIVVVTPEKLLYALRQSPEIAGRIGLIVYDEAHQFDSGARGVTFELLITALKRLIPSKTQTILVSAVVSNAAAVAQWLFSDSERVVVDRRTQTERNVAYVSWTDRLGRLTFVEAEGAGGSYFVPRVISQHQLRPQGREQKVRVFPSKEDAISIGFYLALRLISNGGVALFCGGKPSVGRILKDSIDHFRRGLQIPSPLESSSKVEVAALHLLYQKNFGSDSYLTGAAGLGMFGHHGDMPHGVRLCLEGAMRDQLISLLVCTSTLAQGVNLPIRYLIVTGTRQGNAEMRVRDFQNLMGRAGRAGIHGEGTVIFTDPRLYDLREARRDKWRWDRVQVMVSEHAEDPTGSTLLELVGPVLNSDKSLHLNMGSAELVSRILDTPAEVLDWARSPSSNLVASKFDKQTLVDQIEKRMGAISAIESFLMANRPDSLDGPLSELARELCAETFAYSLADEEERAMLLTVFAAIADHIEKVVAEVPKQRRYGKSLLGVADCIRVDNWVSENVLEFAGAESADQLFDLVWPFLQSFEIASDLASLDPQETAYSLAKAWISGLAYSELALIVEGASLPYGPTRRRSVSFDDLLGLCEHDLGFGVTLILSAIRDSVGYEFEAFQEELNGLRRSVDLLQKRLRYGLPAEASIAFYEVGFCDRVIAQELAQVSVASPANAFEARNLIKSNPPEYLAAVSTFPAYMSGILTRVLGS